MLSTKMVTFGKNENCPSSQELLAFQNEELSAKNRRWIRIHLETCEFCEAELDFYDHHPLTEEDVNSEEIPLPLYELARALLKKGDGDNSSLDDLLNEKKEFELK